MSLQNGLRRNKISFQMISAKSKDLGLSWYIFGNLKNCFRLFHVSSPYYFCDQVAQTFNFSETLLLHLTHLPPIKKFPLYITTFI